MSWNEYLKPDDMILDQMCSDSFFFGGWDHEKWDGPPFQNAQKRRLVFPPLGRHTPPQSIIH